MHESMYNHPIVKENISKLESIGVTLAGPIISEGKAKIADTESILSLVIGLLSKEKPLGGVTILITAGPTIEYIDPVRVITNMSSGKMGIALARCALERGGRVVLVYGPGTEAPPVGAEVVRVTTSDEMYDAVMKALGSRKPEVVIAASAVCDFKVKGKSDAKIPTAGGKELKLALEPTRKIIDSVRDASPNVFLAAFRAVTGLSDVDIVEDAYARLAKARADMIVANDVTREGAGFLKDTNEVFIIDAGKRVTHVPVSPKPVVAARVLDAIAEKLAARKSVG
jgi:phosphopantothenoylcysteine decarboxylase/phosphopantothenate--cysteine ligase